MNAQDYADRWNQLLEYGRSVPAADMREADRHRNGQVVAWDWSRGMWGAIPREMAPPGTGGVLFSKDWDESKHPRGQPDNAGQFASHESGGTEAVPSDPLADTFRTIRNDPKAASYEQIRGLVDELGKRSKAEVAGFAREHLNAAVLSSDSKAKILDLIRNHLENVKQALHGADFDMRGKPSTYARGEPERYEKRHSPKGGVTLGGKHYPGGQWIPAEAWASASTEEKEAYHEKAHDEAEKVKLDDETEYHKKGSDWINAKNPAYKASDATMKRWRKAGRVSTVHPLPAEEEPKPAPKPAAKGLIDLESLLGDLDPEIAAAIRSTMGPSEEDFVASHPDVQAAQSAHDDFWAKHFPIVDLVHPDVQALIHQKKAGHAQAVDAARRKAADEFRQGKAGAKSPPPVETPEKQPEKADDKPPTIAPETPKWVEPTIEPEKPDETPERNDKPHDGVILARELAKKLTDGGSGLTKDEFWDAADDAFGGTRAEGTYGPSDAYDALEAGLNHALNWRTDPNKSLEGAKGEAEWIEEKIGKLPTQTNRSGNKDAYQQFSTPPHYAYAVARAAGIKPGQVVLEPSAGTGCIAIQARNAGGKVVTNELDPKRAAYLEDFFGSDNVHIENAEQIGAILRGKVAPDVVVMNPPFSQTAGRMGDSKELMTGARHIEQAMQLLKPGGRLVAIVGRGMTSDSHTFRGWFNDMAKKYDYRANIGVDGDKVYRKYGTSFDSRVLIFDKPEQTEPPEPGFTGTTTDSLGRTYHWVDGKRVKSAVEDGWADDIPSLMDQLEGVRNERLQRAADEPSGEPVGQDDPGTAGGQDELGAGGPSGERAMDQDASAAPAGRGDAAPAPAGAVGGGTAVGGPAAGADEPVAGGTAGGSGDVVRPGPGDADSGAGGGGKQRGRRRRSPANPPELAGPDVPRDEEGENKRGRGKRAARNSRKKLDAEFASRLSDPVEVAVEEVEPEEKTGSGGELGESLYEAYKPKRMDFPGAAEHPGSMAESAAMAAVVPPPPKYKPVLAPEVVRKDLREGWEWGGLSKVALETVVYAGQAHSQYLPAAEGEKPMRRAYYVGDSTGSGKGRQIAGVIMDNMNQGRKRHVWVSLTKKLLGDAIRDFHDIGGDPNLIYTLDDLKKGRIPDENAVLFMTYNEMISGPRDQSKPRNWETVRDWYAATGGDGVMVFDEAHAMKNAIGGAGGRGPTKPSETGKTGRELQKALPDARVLYSSATGATEPHNLSYADRLGIWGYQQEFPTVEDFVNEMSRGGVAAMESVAQSLRATGSYVSRGLSLNDGTPQGTVEYERLKHSLSDKQMEDYDRLGDAWYEILQNIEKAIGLVTPGGEGETKNAKASMNAYSAFWGSQQRFFSAVTTAMQLPSVIAAMEEDLANGKSPVIQLVNTGAAALEKAKTKRGQQEDPDEIDQEDLSLLDVSPAEQIKTFLEKSFPVDRYEEYLDESGNKAFRPVKDSMGNLVKDPDALALRDRLMEGIDRLKEIIPDSPIDSIINHFHNNTPYKVAEATGRSSRLVWRLKPGTTDQWERVEENRGDAQKANALEAQRFQDGEAHIMVFSAAGGTGASYHASNRAKNQNQRVHYLLQPGWQADKAVQGFGRTHRTDQKSSPIFRLVEIPELKAQKRFISTIARRLDQLGALTKGQRQAGGGGIFTAADNIESPHAIEAMRQMFQDLSRGHNVGNHSAEMLLRRMGFVKGDKGLEPGKDFIPESMGQFLNRMFILPTSMQNDVFDDFMGRLERKLELAKAEGRLDVGVENLPGRVTWHQKANLWTDPESGATVDHIELRNAMPTKKRDWERNTQGELPTGFWRNKRSGQVWAAYDGGMRTDAKGAKNIRHSLLRGVREGSSRSIPTGDLEWSYYGSNNNWEPLNQEEAEKAWRAEHAALPAEYEETHHFVSGAMLPVWKKIPSADSADMKVKRFKLDDGQTRVGRTVPAHLVEAMTQNFGKSHKSRVYEADEAHAAILAPGKTQFRLANGWRIRPALVQGERRIELVPDRPLGLAAHWDELEKDGVFKERIANEARYFIPTGDRGRDVLKRITTSRPIVERIDPEKFERATEWLANELGEPDRYEKPPEPSRKVRTIERDANGYITRVVDEILREMA